MYDSIKDEFLQSIERTSVSPKTIYRIRGRSPEISKEFLIEIGFPKSIIDITDRISLQMSIGNGLLPHTDFGRRTSLFYLLTEHTDNWLTNWYQHNEEIKSLRDPNNYGFTWTWINQEHTRLTLKESVNIKHKQWYIFNNEAYHSVYSNEDYSKDQIRVSLCVECDATVEELYNILNECN
jgi:hypothetical protein